MSENNAKYPATRLRRLRKNAALRDLVRENHLSVNDFIYPLFITYGKGIKKEIVSMPGIFQLSIDALTQEINELTSLGIKAVMLFGIPEHKDPIGEENFHDNGIIQQAIKAIKAINSDMLVMTDVCLCEYTDHGHCGVVANGEILNDETHQVLAKVALSHANAGADLLAPSGMMDGGVGVIRNALESNGFTDMPVMAYSAKYASAFYGPFRDAADGAPQFGDRKSYQMDPANMGEAMREIALDIDEGADCVIVKPGMPYLDVIRQAHIQFPEIAIVAYNVSGEYSMVKAAAMNGWLDERSTVEESLIAFKRAGARLIITYWAKQYAQWLMEEQ